MCEKNICPGQMFFLICVNALFYTANAALEPTMADIRCCRPVDRYREFGSRNFSNAVTGPSVGACPIGGAGFDQIVASQKADPEMLVG